VQGQYEGGVKMGKGAVNAIKEVANLSGDIQNGMVTVVTGGKVPFEPGAEKVSGPFLGH
jgi:hypothetical protein